jgi:hypothetical protein
MAHFAELDESNNVLRVIVVNNNDILDENNVESEEIGINFCKNLLGGNWKQCSFNNTFRKNYPDTEFFYDSVRDAFVQRKPPGDHYQFDEEKCVWIDTLWDPTTVLIKANDTDDE